MLRRTEKKTIGIKWRLIFVPFLIIAAGFIILYTLLNLLFYQTQLIPIDEKLVNVWLPFTLPWIPLLIWLRPRINFLRLKRKNGKDLDGLYYLVAAAAIIIPTLIAQEFLDTTIGTRTDLQTVAQIDTNKLSKFYTIQRYFIDKKHIGFERTAEVGGKYNQNLTLTVYVVCPILQNSPESPLSTVHSRAHLSGNPLILINGQIQSRTELESLSAQDIESIQIIKGKKAVQQFGEAGKKGVLVVTLKNLESKWSGNTSMRAPRAWLTVKFDTLISNRLTASEKDQAFKAFLIKAENEFNSTELAGFSYLRRLPEGGLKKNYSKAVIALNVPVGRDLLLLQPVYKPFEERSGKKVSWFFGSFCITAGLFFVILLFPRLSSAAINRYYNPPRKKLSFSDVLHSVGEQSSLYITYGLILVNILIFIAMVFSGLGIINFQGQDLLKWGGNFGPLIKQGQWWRLISNTFLHGGLMHLVLNMYGLLFVGMFLEPLLGRLKFVFAYLGTALIASLASFLWYDRMISVGASGAIFGMYGTFLALLVVNVFPKRFKQTFLLTTLGYVLINLMMGIRGGIDNAAHLGGLVSGFLVGLALYPGLKKRQLIEAGEIEKKELDA